ncbi:C40 family peptidase [Streptomyces sp. CA2R106]|uniref:C40 family peptidase n=1 Tax=Streptomyces sp. CA2R106 TaxID=3120153 RepID=UPI0030092720
MAESTHTTTTAAAPSRAGLEARSATFSTTASAQQAVAALEREALAAALAADQEKAAADAAKSAAKAHKAALRKAAAAAKAKAAKAEAAAKAAAQSAATASTGSAGQSSTTATTAATTSGTTATAASSSKADQLIAFLKSQLGKPYVYGATGPDSYDCSGLTQAAFASIGIDIPRTSQEQSTAGTPVSLSALQPGDLIFWGGEGSAYHVGVFIGNGQYLDAANSSTPVAIHQLADYEPDWAVNVL